MPVFMKFDGIKGESRDDKHKDEIDVLAWSWGVDNAGSAAIGRGGGSSGKPNFQELSITKLVDSASDDLLFKCASGERIEFGTLSVTRRGEQRLEYLFVKVSNVIVTSVRQRDQADDEGDPIEEVTLNYSKIAFGYRPTKDGNEGELEEFGWDLAKNKPS